MARGKGPEFTRFFRPIIEALKEKGGSGTTTEIIDRAIELLGLSEAEQNVGIMTTKNLMKFRPRKKQLKITESVF